MHAAQEDRAGLAPDAEFMTARQIAIEPVPHGRSSTTDGGFGWLPYGKSDAARRNHCATAYKAADQPATIFEFLRRLFQKSSRATRFGCVPRLHTKIDVAHGFVRWAVYRGSDGAASQAMTMPSRYKPIIGTAKVIWFQG